MNRPATFPLPGGDPVSVTRTPGNEPVAGEGKPRFAVLRMVDTFPSAATLEAIAELRARHVAKGHTPATDALHGPLFFKLGRDEFLIKANRAETYAERRKALIAAAAMIVAQIDAEDFQQEANP